MELKQIFQILLLLPFLSIAIVLTDPVKNTTENVTIKNLDSQNPPSASASSPCRNVVDYHSVPQLVFPTCTSSLGREGLRNVVMHGMACTCDLNTHGVLKRDDYHYTLGIGAHKLHTRGASFNNARKVCQEEGGHLAIIDTVAEEQVLLDLFNKSGPMRSVSLEGQAFIGIHDLFAEGEWVTILGDSLHKYGYTKWSDRWNGQPDNGGGVQHCGTLLKEGGMDDVNCNLQFAFFCEISGIRISN